MSTTSTALQRPRSLRQLARRRRQAAFLRSLRVDGATLEATYADVCDPLLCEVGSRPHIHCTCGLAMAVEASVCELCFAEGLDPAGWLDSHALPWDGVSYPSRRRSPIGVVDPAVLGSFIAAVLQPDAEGDGG